MDKDKVVRGLECLTGDRDRYPDPCKGCRYVNLKNYANCVKAIAKDAIAMLKEQEAVTEYVMDEYQPTCKACGFRPFVGYIPSLEWMRERGFKFCSHCGQELKWE